MACSVGREGIRATLHVIASIMNSLVVQIMNAKNNITANDKFIGEHFALLHRLRGYARRHPIVVTADLALGAFIASEANRK